MTQIPADLAWAGSPTCRDFSLHSGQSYTSTLAGSAARDSMALSSVTAPYSVAPGTWALFGNTTSSLSQAAAVPSPVTSVAFAPLTATHSLPASEASAIVSAVSGASAAFAPPTEALSPSYAPLAVSLGVPSASAVQTGSLDASTSALLAFAPFAGLQPPTLFNSALAPNMGIPTMTSGSASLNAISSYLGLQPVPSAGTSLFGLAPNFGLQSIAFSAAMVLLLR